MSSSGSRVRATRSANAPGSRVPSLPGMPTISAPTVVADRMMSIGAWISERMTNSWLVPVHPAEQTCFVGIPAAIRARRHVQRHDQSRYLAAEADAHARRASEESAVADLTTSLQASGSTTGTPVCPLTLADAAGPDLQAALSGELSSASYTLSDMAADTVGLLKVLGLATE